MPKKISQCPSAAIPLTGNEDVLLNQSGTTKTAKVSSVRGDFNASTLSSTYVTNDKLSSNYTNNSVLSSTYVKYSALSTSIIQNLDFVAPNEITLTYDTDPAIKIYKIPQTDAEYSSDATDAAPVVGNWYYLYFDNLESLHRLQLFTDGSENLTWYGGGSDPSLVEDGIFTTWQGPPILDMNVEKTYLNSTARFVTNGVNLHVNLSNSVTPIWKQISIY